ncbi:MAG: HAD family hydrolase [Gammaproteobacteria bacterium]
MPNDALNNARVNAVLFDLDGTLADTSPDMADALNLLFANHNMQALDYELIRQNTSRGSVAMIQLGFEETLDEKYSFELRDEFLQLYADNLCNRTTLFPGVSELLTFLGESDIPWGIVTNKPGNLAEPLVQELNIAFNAVCMVSGDSLARRKPDPDQLHHAANMLGINEQDIVYMGDDPRDVQAGKAAGMQTAVAAYGYIQDDHDPNTWDADVILQQALDLKDWLFSNS